MSYRGKCHKGYENDKLLSFCFQQNFLIFLTAASKSKFRHVSCETVACGQVYIYRVRSYAHTRARRGDKGGREWRGDRDHGGWCRLLVMILAGSMSVWATYIDT